MKANIQEVKDIVEFKLDYLNSSLPSLIGKNSEDGIIEDTIYYEVKDIYVYINGLDKYLNNQISLNDFINWFNVARATLIFSFMRLCVPGIFSFLVTCNNIVENYKNNEKLKEEISKLKELLINLK